MLVFWHGEDEIIHPERLLLLHYLERGIVYDIADVQACLFQLEPKAPAALLYGLHEMHNVIGTIQESATYVPYMILAMLWI